MWRNSHFHPDSACFFCAMKRESRNPEWTIPLLMEKKHRIKRLRISIKTGFEIRING
jgi:hypothetical protein